MHPRALVAASLLLCTSVMAAQPPTFSRLNGALIQYLQNRRLSGDGTVVTCGPKYWTPDTGWRTFMTTGVAYGLSADGTTAFGYRSLPNADIAAYRWSLSGVSEQLPFGTDFHLATASASSRDATIIFGSAQRLAPEAQAMVVVRWNGTQPPASFPLPAPFNVTYTQSSAPRLVYGVSGSGNTAVGMMWLPDGPYPLVHAFAWREESGVVDLGVPPEFLRSSARAVSEHGDVIAGRADGQSPSAIVRWTANGAEVLGRLQTDSSEATADDVLAMSADGSVIVGHGGAANDQRATLWTRSLGIVDLNDYLASLGVDLTGYSLVTCFGISDDHTTLVGSGIVVNGFFGFAWRVTGLPHLPGTPCGASDIAGPGAVTGFDGVTDNNDFVLFVDYFCSGDAHADRGRKGGIPGSDGAFDNNDFVVFIDQFFAGC